MCRRNTAPSFRKTTMLLVSNQLNGWAYDKVTDRLVGFFSSYHRLLRLNSLSMTCRRRKLKCDEQKPRCGQCCKANRECQLSSGIVFRHQQNASMNAQPDGAGPSSNSLGGFYSYKNTFEKGSVWLETPKQRQSYSFPLQYARLLIVSVSHLCQCYQSVHRS